MSILMLIIVWAILWRLSEVMRVFLYMACLVLFLASCASNNMEIGEGSEEVFVVEDSYSPYDWHRTYHGPDRFFYRRDQFILEP